MDDRFSFGVVSNRGPLSNVWVVATLRSDFFSKCEESEDLIQLMGDKGQYRLLPPNSNELSQIIRFPARSAGVTFEDNASKERLDEVLRDAAGAASLVGQFGKTLTIVRSNLRPPSFDLF